MVKKNEDRVAASGSAAKHRADDRFMQAVRGHLSYRDDAVLEEYIARHRPYSWLAGTPHENPMAVVARQLCESVGSPTPVVIEGPPGSGRFAVASVLSDLEDSGDSPWTVVSCPGADPKHLVDSITPGGVLLLREIDRSDGPFQNAILGILGRASGNTPRRVVCTTSRDLSLLVEGGTFDALLGQRLHIGRRILIPPLAEREWDIPPIVVSVVRRVDPEGSVRFISYAALHFLLNFNWTGDVQQLISVVEDAIRTTISEGDDTLRFPALADRFKRVTPSGGFPKRPFDVFDEDERYVDYLPRFGSEEVARFAAEQYRKSVYSEPSEDHQRMDDGWSAYDWNLWTGCYEVAGNSHVAYELYDLLRKPKPLAPPIDDLKGDEAVLALAMRQRTETLEQLAKQVKPRKLDASYGVHPYPINSDHGRGTLIQLDFSELFASPEWLTDQTWELRNSWNVPLKWADERILFDVGKMRERLVGFLLLPNAAIEDKPGVAFDSGGGANRREEPKEIGGNVFKFNGASWVLSFMNKTINSTNKIGLHRIVAVLQTPNKPVGAYILWQIGEATPTEDGAIAVERTTVRPQSTRLKPPICKDEILDAKARNEIEGRIEKLEEEYQFAEQGGRLDEAEQIQSDLDTLRSEIGKAYGFGGRPRTQSSDESRAADSVGRSIRYAIEQVMMKHPQLGLHLKSSIKTGRFITYSPEEPITWVT